MPFSSRAPAPMPIPNSRHDRPPPPLPPPRFIEDLAAGSDPGWAWGNDPGGGFGKARGPFTAGSNFPKSWNREMEDRDLAQSPVRPPYIRRDSSTSTVRSNTDAERRHQDFMRQQDEGYYSLSGPRSSAMSQQLHGERQLQQRNTESSSQTYDNKLLSKLGKPKTPPRTSVIGSLESSPTSSLPYHMSGRHPNQLRSLSFPHNASNSAYSSSGYAEDSPIKREPSDYGGSPLSRPISPNLPTFAASGRNLTDWRSPTLERGTPSSATEANQYLHYPQRFPSSTNVLRQQKSRRSTSGSLLSSYDESAASSGKSTASNTSAKIKALKRESYDQGMFSEPDSADSTFRMEDSVRHLHLEDRVPPTVNKTSLDSIPYHHSSSLNPFLHTSRSRPGMQQRKRKQSQSPPLDLSGAHAPNAQMLAAAGMEYRNTSQYPAQRLSPVHRFGQTQGSISSQSSAGPRNNSYPSSAGLSAGSSITSLDQPSPGTISPSSEQQVQHYQQQNGQDSPYVTSLPINQDQRNTRPQPQQEYPHAPLETLPDPSVDQKPQTTQAQRRNTGPNMQSSAYICACCPKKPKKFETPHELRNHEAEKQYSCNYCTNRFKNKNEAERHQNSIHLRKQFWSCATLNGTYDKAFYPSTSIPPADNASAQQPPPPPNQVAAFDTCGYCGDQFANEPQPDWDARATHLTNQHKFGECNQSKKFFRADHFRQHLKHSHAGTSGKWTNKLEEACVKEEPSPAPHDSSQSPGAPVANMGMAPGMRQTNMSQANMNVGPNNGQNIGQSISQANIANMVQSSMGQQQQSMGQGNMSQQGMSQAAMAQQAQQIVQMDMSNIDPNIGLHQMGNLARMGDMTTMAVSGPGMNMQSGQMRDDRIDEMPQEM